MDRLESGGDEYTGHWYALVLARNTTMEVLTRVRLKFCDNEESTLLMNSPRSV